jgi:hypothetical protein
MVFDQDSIVAALEGVGRRLELPERDLVGPVVARLPARSRPQPRSHRILAVAAAILVIALVTLALPGPREAIARLLGIDGVRITHRDELPPDLDQTLALGQPLTLDAAREQAGNRRLVPAGFDPPDGAFAGRPRGAVTLVWAPAPDRPEVAHTGVGLIVSAFPGFTEPPLIEKQLLPGTSLERVSVNGAEGAWISGAHHVLLYIDRENEPLEDTTRLAGNTVIWSDAGITYRLESALDRDTAVALAESLQPLGRR